MPRHHLVPQLLLRRFADEQERIVMVARHPPHRSLTTRVKTACAKVGFYEVATEDVEEDHRAGHDPEGVERVLSEVEGSAAPMLARLIAGQFPPPDEERFRVALFAALLVTRGWGFRQDMNEMGTWARSTCGLTATGRVGTRRRKFVKGGQWTLRRLVWSSTRPVSLCRPAPTRLTAERSPTCHPRPCC